MMEIAVDKIQFDAAGLVPVIVQQARTSRVLMLAYMNKESLQRTIETGETHFWSRSRRELWHKGDTSGNTQRVVRIAFDCDADALLVEVEQKGNACHTGKYSCFHHSLVGDEKERKSIGSVLASLELVVQKRKKDLPDGSYTTYLFKSGLDKILKKMGEESAETIIAAKNHNKQEIATETADLLYHLLVLLAEENVLLNDVAVVLEEREGKKSKKG